MDPEFSLPEENAENPALLPMFVAGMEPQAYYSPSESETPRGGDGAFVERDWLTERMMDAYN